MGSLLNRHNLLLAGLVWALSSTSVATEWSFHLAGRGLEATFTWTSTWTQGWAPGMGILSFICWDLVENLVQMGWRWTPHGLVVITLELVSYVLPFIWFGSEHNRAFVLKGKMSELPEYIMWYDKHPVTIIYFLCVPVSSRLFSIKFFLKLESVLPPPIPSTIVETMNVKKKEDTKWWSKLWFQEN